MRPPLPRACRWSVWGEPWHAPSALSKYIHQSLDTVSLFEPVTKYSAEVDAPEAIGEVLAAAFRAAESGRPGAAFISLPMDMMTGSAPNVVLAPVRPQELGAGPTEAIADAAQLIDQAKLPVLLLGMQASEPANATAVRALLEKVPLPCVCTYQGAGASFLKRDGSVWKTDKDGLILGLLAAEITARTGKDPGEHYKELTAKFGIPYSTRIDAPATPDQKNSLKKLSPEAVTATELAGEAITAKPTRAPGNNASIGGLKVVR